MLTKTLIKYSSLFLRDIDKNDIRIFLESSPSYPNLLSVLATLRHVGLDAQVGQCDWEYLKNLDSPFLLHIKSGDRQNLVIAKWDRKQNCLRILNPRNKKWEIKGSEDMGRHWDGVVIYTSDHQIDLHFRTTVGIILSVITSLGLLVLFKTNILNIEILFYSPLILGFAVSCCLYLKSEMADGGMIDKLCHISKVTDCKRVEESKYSSVFGFKLDCLAFSFFIAQVTCVSVSYLFGISDVLYPLYFISTVVSLPTIAYSVYGQLKVRNICPLCVIVALCIATEAVKFICRDNQEMDMSVITLYGCIFLLSLAASQYNSYIRNKGNNLFADSITLLKLKRKREIVLIESSLAKQTSSPIGFGNETSTPNITTILSPSCNHCRKVVSDFLALRQKGLDFRWNIILGQTTQADVSIIEDWLHRFLTDKDKFFEDLTLWSKGATQMSAPISQNSVKDIEYSSIRQSFNRQIAELHISGFPQIVLNDRLLSSVYTSKDLEFLILDKNIIQ